MLLPRLASIALVIIAAIIITTAFNHLLSEPYGTVTHQFLIMNVIVWGFATLAGTGGVIASFGLESVGPGCVKSKNTLIGKLLGKIAGDEKQFCNISLICAIVLFFTLMFSAVAVGLIVSCYFEPKLALIFVAIGIAVPPLYWVANRYENAFFGSIVALIFGGLAALVIYQIMRGTVPQSHLSLKDLAAIGVAFGLCGIAFAPFVLGKWLLLRMRFYSTLCPTRLSEESKAS